MQKKAGWQRLPSHPDPAPWMGLVGKEVVAADSKSAPTRTVSRRDKRIVEPDVSNPRDAEIELD